MKLTDRLLKIASLASDGKKIADIGTDHGYIPVYLLKEGKVPFAVLADVNKGPLDNAHKEVIQNNLLDKVDLRLGSGIEILEIGEVEEVIIAGMGGILISELLEAKKEVAHNVEKLILQPMQAQEELRYYLLNNGYEILEEVLVREDFRIYEIIVAKYTGKNTIIEDEIYYEVGIKLLENKDSLFNDFIEKKIKTYSSIVNKLEGKNGEAIDKKRKESEVAIKKLENLIK
ncbi:TPA: SAM-dependent methyltransferase [Clostridioides difficile]|uniref:SAM-dependent methyltransferase n=1 Tax=Clostridioides difficile ATCC 9689 = DSM 1296 TaxID=1121308 RepID=A0AC59FYJ0_CLODI|nr:class I SAM-dependent methyltransferase [Clostridioides difficile]AKP42401.1 putative SAM-dependent methyltransferase [Clostridioides difficile ATCC 9689 = DSM 1296]ARC14026.1 SAM-dependent methyltransferase [Clostridioides difficile]AVI11979.1 SAM-dependent methyltransferase [Clostridioides difficile]AXU86345.1 putative SAM-dependent methyltransferase [Clostridioides difficile]EGT3643083.1 SAM-dependent methyltransferase [Clostridioides difficile]